MSITEKFKRMFRESPQERFDRVVRQEVESMKKKRELGIGPFARATDADITATAVALAIIVEDKPAAC